MLEVEDDLLIRGSCNEYGRVFAPCVELLADGMGEDSPLVYKRRLRMVCCMA